jgi:hypothetical protein
LTGAAAARHGHRHAAPLSPRTPGLDGRSPHTWRRPSPGTSPPAEWHTPPGSNPLLTPRAPSPRSAPIPTRTSGSGSHYGIAAIRRGIVRSPCTRETERGRSCGGQRPPRAQKRMICVSPPARSARQSAAPISAFRRSGRISDTSLSGAPAGYCFTIRIR